MINALSDSETASTQRSRECRNRQKLLDSNTTPTDCKQISNGEIEKELEIKKEKKKEIEIEIDY